MKLFYIDTVLKRIIISLGAVLYLRDILIRMWRMLFRWVFIIYIAALSAFDGFVDQDSHEVSFNKGNIEAYAQSENSPELTIISSQSQNDQNSESDCPDPENCHSCHQCMGHCGYLMSNYSIESIIFSDSNFTSYIKALT